MGSNINIKSDKVTDLEPTSLGIIVEKPKFPHFASKSNRLESFATWPDSHTINKNNLVEAGFVFTGRFIINFCAHPVYECVSVI